MIDISTTKQIEVYATDLPGVYDWYTGMDGCIDLGDRWRMPTKDELNMMWKRKDAIGGFVDAYYWSTSEYNELRVWVQYFTDGVQGYSYKCNAYRVRPVRDVV